MTDPPIVCVDRLTHRYGARLALDSLCLDVTAGSLVALLGPNGSGKTTLFKVLTTLLVPDGGTAHVAGYDVAVRAAEVRRRIGVVFQNSSLDDRLTVLENLIHQGHLYGLSGAELRRRAADVLDRFGVSDRQHEIVGRLSGGLQRRVELAKALLHRPVVLMSDEPGTGLDPAVRLSTMQYLDELRSAFGMTVMLTTHLLDEADRCDRVVILDEGKVVAGDSPAALKRSIGGDMVIVETASPVALAQKIAEKFSVPAAVAGATVRIEWARGHEFVGALVKAFPGEFERVTVGPPTLEDAFIHLTGHRLHDSENAPSRRLQPARTLRREGSAKVD